MVGRIIAFLLVALLVVFLVFLNPHIAALGKLVIGGLLGVAGIILVLSISPRKRLLRPPFPNWQLPPKPEPVVDYAGCGRQKVWRVKMHTALLKKAFALRR